VSLFAWLGGLVLAALGISVLGDSFKGLAKRWKAERAIKKASEFDWKVIQGSLDSPRPRRDCEREESLGICTGRDCLVYESCNFAIKKVVH
jgi:hypothetical protein